MNYRAAWTAVWKKYPDDRLFYSLVFLGGMSVWFTFVWLVSRFPTNGEWYVIAVAVFVWLKLVTLPYLDARMETLEQATLREEREAREHANASGDSGKGQSPVMRIPGLYRLVVYLRTKLSRAEHKKTNTGSDLSGVVNVHGPNMASQI